MSEPTPTLPPAPRTAVLWHDGVEHVPLPPLRGERQADVVVVGGGIVGLTTALMLARAGREVVVLEACRLARQATAASTAKVTALHGLVYADLVTRLGTERARLYAEANQWAVDHLGVLAGELGDIGFRRADAFTYATGPRGAAAVEREAEAAVRLGLPAEVVRDSELPFPILAAVRLGDQAEVHPVRLLLALADALIAQGVAVHEQSRVVAVEDGQPIRVRTDTGASVTAAHVVVATHLPFPLRGGFFAKTTPRRRPCVSALVDGERLSGLHKSAGEPSRSVRGATDADGATRVIAIGDSFEPGTADEARWFRELEDWVRKHFPVRAVTHRWGNMDYHSADGVPYVGRLHRLSGGLWTATGFGAWGLSNGIAAARMLSDAIVGRRNAWLPLFDATRLVSGGGLGALLKRNLHVGQMWAGRLRPAPAEDGSDLAPGEGKVVRRGGRKVGLARDRDGALHAVSAICTHMGCVLGWNGVEESWDCPCHGSRFSIDGDVLHGPAVADLEQFDVEAGADGRAGEAPG
ncbi:FAD-dependent oxidoreductase [Novispirillum sp. DQ9]|uniref:FAD-dependent oxidoreductase n=1 Tax=Novispirillum sp. DQ9 TaxID=3398612 RepID=UPI003C79F791